jgi:hypothetical protein
MSHARLNHTFFSDEWHSSESYQLVLDWFGPAAAEGFLSWFDQYLARHGLDVRMLSHEQFAALSMAFDPEVVTWAAVRRTSLRIKERFQQTMEGLASASAPNPLSLMEAICWGDKKHLFVPGVANVLKKHLQESSLHTQRNVQAPAPGEKKSSPSGETKQGLDLAEYFRPIS